MKPMKRKNKFSLLKNILRTLPVLLGVSVVTYAGILIKDFEMPEVLPVNDVQVNGEFYFLDKDEIESSVKNNITGDYFTLDLNKIRAVLIQEPWIKNVALRRQWPASLNVYIEEQVPVAYWNDNGFINDMGEIFKPVTIVENLDLPRLNGPEGQHDNVWKFMNILYKETTLLDYEVVYLNLDDRRAWQLVIDGSPGADNEQIEVKLGRFDTEKRMKRFVHILPALTDEHGLTGKTNEANRIKVIDMRYPNGFAVQMHEINDLETSRLLDEKSMSHDFGYAKQLVTVEMGEA